jgi:hypothetical protein
MDEDRAEQDDEMTLDRLRQQIQDFLGFRVYETTVSVVIHETVKEDGYRRLRISYTSQDDDQIPAFLLLPDGGRPFAAVLIFKGRHYQRTDAYCKPRPQPVPSIRVGAFRPKLLNLTAHLHDRPDVALAMQRLREKE